MRAKKTPVEIQISTIGERIDKLCLKCDEERGHIVSSINKRGQISRVSCSKCSTVTTFKAASRTTPKAFRQAPTPYDMTVSYRTGQTMSHKTFGIGEVTQLIEPRKIDVLFQDRVRRLVHAR
jgi:hypothetical protein